MTLDDLAEIISQMLVSECKDCWMIQDWAGVSYEIVGKFEEQGWRKVPSEEEITEYYSDTWGERITPYKAECIHKWLMRDDG